ncbi:hypothetical protein QTP88_004808 [Uroleucon formosanum]
MTDFEQGLIDAFTNVFPEIHQKYMNDADFGLKIKQLMALAFVPVPHVVENFDKLMLAIAFSSLLAASHPTIIWRLIEVLKKEQHLTEVKINQFFAAQEPSAKKKKYRDVARRIKNIMSTYDERDLDE